MGRRELALGDLCRCLALAGPCLQGAQPLQLLARRRELFPGRVLGRLARGGLRLQLRDARCRSGRLRHGVESLLQAAAGVLEIGPELLAGAAQHLHLVRELVGLRRGLAQRLDLRLRLRERLAQLVLARVPLAVGGALAFGELALQRGHARLQLARAAGRLLALGQRGRQLGAQRGELLLGIARLAPGCHLGGESLDLLLQLALAQVGELAIDHVLQPGAQLEQLDLVDGDLALELAQLLGRDRRRLGPVARRLRGDQLELALAVGELRLEPFVLDREVVHERRILEHGLRDRSPVALALDVALELLDAPLLPVHGIAQLHRGGGLLGQPLTAVGILEVGNGALAFFQYLQALVELHLQFLQDALTLLEDPMLDGLVLDASQRSAQAPARAGLGGLLEAVLENAIVVFVCDGASLVRGFLSTDMCGA